VRFISLFVVVCGMISLSCGRTEQKVELKNKLLDDANDSTCKAKNCPEVDYKLVDGSGVDISSKVFVGVKNSSVEWTIKVKSTAASGRIKIAPVQWPGWMNRRDAGSAGSMQIYGTPDNVVTENTVRILARDISRCAALEKSTKQCSDPQSELPDYDKVFTLKYSIKDP
jgi:hypothetical protein